MQSKSIVIQDAWDNRGGCNTLILHCSHAHMVDSLVEKDDWKDDKRQQPWRWRRQSREWLKYQQLTTNSKQVGNWRQVSVVFEFDALIRLQVTCDCVEGIIYATYLFGGSDSPHVFCICYWFLMWCLPACSRLSTFSHRYCGWTRRDRSSTESVNITML